LPELEGLQTVTLVVEQVFLEQRLQGRHPQTLPAGEEEVEESLLLALLIMLEMEA
jgi:hypothetical protein